MSLANPIVVNLSCGAIARIWRYQNGSAALEIFARPESPSTVAPYLRMDLNPEDTAAFVSSFVVVDDAKAGAMAELLLEAIEIIAGESEDIRASYAGADGTVNDADARAEIERYDSWLKDARSAVAVECLP